MDTFNKRMYRFNYKRRPNLLKKTEKQPVEESVNKKIVVSADSFSDFENLRLNLKQRKSSGSSECSSVEEKTSSCSSDVLKNNQLRLIKIPKKFEEVLIKDEIHENTDNKLKNTDKKDKILKEGEVQTSIKAAHGFTPSDVLNKSTSPAPAANNRVFIIKNQAGKSVTLISKSTPVVLNKAANINKPEVSNTLIESVNRKKGVINVRKTLELTKKSVVKNPLVINRTLQRIKPLKPLEPRCKNIIKRLPNTHVMKISDLNKSQKYFNNLKVSKPENLAPKFILPKPEVPKIIDLTDEPEVMKNVEPNSMPNFSKILHVLSENPPKNDSSVSKNVILADEKIPIYIDSTTQTDNTKSFSDAGVQTEVYVPSPSSSVEDLPNITNLLEYVFNTPKYSSGLDEMKKNDLIDMSKTIVTKSKTMSSLPKGEDGLKKQLFLDLKDCATFDFLGNKPLHNAVLENNIHFLKRQIFALRLRKITIDIENNQGQTALQLAILHNCSLEIITTLLGNGASTNIVDHEGNNIIHLAVINSTHFVLEVLLKYLVDPKIKINRKNDEGLTPLMIAAIDSKPEIVDMLLRNKADPNQRDEKSGRTALFHAVELNCNFVINLLLKYKADPKVRNFFGLTALDAAKDLDISDPILLETEKEPEISKNQTSVIVHNVNRSSQEENPAHSARAHKRNKPLKVEKGTKKSKLCFVPSLMKVAISDVKKTTSNRKRKK